MKTFKLFSKYSGLKPNISKCEDVVLGSLKVVKVTVRGIKCVELRTETIRILLVHFSYNQKLQIQRKHDKNA